MNRSVLLFIVISNTGFTQNWNVFNKDYRYNYRFDNSNVVSHVLFQDSVKKVGNDSVYYLNRIAAPCNGNCAGLSGVLSPTQNVIVANMPQFLQRTIEKKNNGTVMLRDTAKLVLRPFCVLNETWLFDSISNFTATCKAITTQSFFGTSDSVKHIVINNIDTLTLSKKFGIIRFPQLYGKNKSYRLTGIEKHGTYDSTSLFGEKVPNAWDFYDFDVGDIFCRMIESWAYVGGGDAGSFTCQNYQASIIGKTITVNGYQYQIDTYSTYDFQMYTKLLNCNKAGQYSSGFLNYSNLSSDSLDENRMYPGKLLETGSPNVVEFGRDGGGRFYKVLGVSSCGTPYAGIPNGKYWGLEELNPPTPGHKFYKSNPMDVFYLQFGESVGMVSTGYQSFEHIGSNCYMCLKKNGVDIFGQPFVGLNENRSIEVEGQIFPNPAAEYLEVKALEPAEIRIYDTQGKVVYSSFHSSGTKIDTSKMPNGIYSLLLVSSNGSSVKKFIVSR